MFRSLYFLVLACFLSYVPELMAMSGRGDCSSLLLRPARLSQPVFLIREESFAQKTPRELIKLWLNSKSDPIARSRIERFASTVIQLDLTKEKFIELGLLKAIKILYLGLRKLKVSHRVNSKKVGTSYTLCGDELAEQVACLFPGLTHLTIRSCLVTNNGLAALCRGCPHLEYLDISSNCLSDSDDDGIAFLRDLKNLKVLNLEGNVRLGNQKTIHILRGLTQLELLNISQTNFTEELLQELFKVATSPEQQQGLINLRALRIRNLSQVLRFSDHLIELLIRLPRLATLDVNRSHLTPSNYEKLEIWQRTQLSNLG